MRLRLLTILDAAPDLRARTALIGSAKRRARHIPGKT